MEFQKGDAIKIKEGPFENMDGTVDELLPAPPGSDSGLSSECRRIIAAIDDLPPEEREVFDLVRLQGMTQVEAAAVLGVATRTVKRRLDRGLLLLTGRLSDLRPSAACAEPS